MLSAFSFYEQFPIIFLVRLGLLLSDRTMNKFPSTVLTAMPYTYTDCTISLRYNVL